MVDRRASNRRLFFPALAIDIWSRSRVSPACGIKLVNGGKSYDTCPERWIRLHSGTGGSTSVKQCEATVTLHPLMIA